MGVRLRLHSVEPEPACDKNDPRHHFVTSPSSGVGGVFAGVDGVLIFAVWPRCLKVRRRQARMRARCIPHLPIHALARDVRTHACTGSGGGGGGG